jgi:outer membrane biosynthesis protein TonB
MPTYVRMPEPDPAAGAGGIPPRPVREASPLAVPGGERAWLPFAFGALVLLLCAVVLFFGVRGLPQFSGASPAEDPTEEPTEEVEDVLPTRTVVIEPTNAPEPTAAPTDPPAPTAAPQPVTAAATDVLNIRQGPDRTTPSLGKLQPNQTVTVVGRNGDGTWLQIVRPDGQGNGWVSAEFTVVTGDINTLPVVTGDSSGTPPQPTETPTG